MLLLMCGSRDLKYRIVRPDHKDMYDSLAAHWEFRGLSEDECRDLVRRRIEGAGASPDIIDSAVMDQLYGLCGKGNFRELGSLMRDALLIGAQAGRSVIDMNVIRSALKHREL